MAIILALALACASGVLYFYMLFLEGRIRQQQRRIAELERTSAALAAELYGTEAGVEALARPNAESWPELIDEM